MKTIARKSMKSGIFYLILTLLSVLFFIIALTDNKIYVCFIDFILFSFCLYIFLKWLFLPSIIISEDDNGLLHLPNDIIISPGDIKDVSRRNLHGRYAQYSFGFLTITTVTDEYKFDFVADLEKVSKTLTDIMYRAKYSSASSKNDDENS